MDKKAALSKLDGLEKEAAQLRKIIEQSESRLDKVKTIYSLYEELGRKRATESDFKFLPKEQRAKQVAFSDVKALEEYFNEGWTKNWSNRNEYYYYPYFERSVDGCWAFYGSYGYYCADCNGPVGFYKSKEVSDHIGKYFKDVYVTLAGE